MSNKYPGGFVSLGGPTPSNSVVFDGSGDYLSVPDDTAFDFGAGDFTIEGWINTSSSVEQIFAAQWPGGSDRGWVIALTPSSSTFLFAYTTNGTTQINASATASLPVGAWTHIALCRSSSNLNFFANGVLVGTASIGSSTIYSSSTALLVGAYTTGVTPFFGYISNFRIVKGAAVYTSSFVVPTGPLKNITNTSLLTCQSPTLVDNSSNGFTVTAVGNAAVSSAQPPFPSYNPNSLDPALGAATPGMWTLSQALNAQVTRSWPMYDPYYKNVVLNLHGDGTNGAQNNTFLDSSASPNTITRNGNTTQGTFSPYGQGWSNYFGGSGNYLSMPSNAAFDFATGAYTVEAWVFLTSYAANEAVLFCNGNANGAIACSINTSGQIYLSKYGTGQVITGSAGDVPLNQWNHVAYVRSSTASNDTKLYVNGVLKATGTDTNNWNVTTTPTVGGLTISNFSIIGNVSNLRVVKGTAVYTSAFTPSTTPLTAISGTSLLTCQSNRFIDAGTANSGSPFSITVTGSPTVQRFSPFLFPTSYTPSTIGGSVYADGTGANYLTAPVNSAFALGSNSFTVEGWIYLTQFNTYNFIYDRASGGTNATTEIELNINSSGTLNCSVYVGSTQYSVGAATGALTLNQWQHIAFVRNGTSGQIYINGVASGSAVTITGSLNDTSSAPNIRYQAPSANRGMTGYLADFRLVNGTAVYTGTFTPPTGPLSASMGANPFGGSNTAAATATLLLNSTNAGIFDNAMMNDLETVGNAQISTSVKKYGTGSMYFDGTGDYLQMRQSPIGEFRGAFTMECWVYLNALPNDEIGFFESIDWNGQLGQYCFGISAANKLLFYMYDGANQYYLSSATLVTSQWIHCAVSRDASGNGKLFINGVNDGTFTNSYPLTNIQPNPYKVGASKIGGTLAYLNGYIDDLRITSGVARYVANFTPPTSQLQDQ